MLVGLCLNPICSASCRCRLHVCSKRFYNKTKRQTRVLLQGRALVCRRLLGLCFQRCSFRLRGPTTWLDRGSSYFSIKARKEKMGNRAVFFRADGILSANFSIRSIIKASAIGMQECQQLCKTAALRLRKNQRLDSCERICLLMLISSSSWACKFSKSAA